MEPALPSAPTVPWDHQIEAYRFAHPRRAAMLAMDMGTGKSRCVVDLVVGRQHRRTLILCPLSVVPAWPRQFREHAGEAVAVAPLRGTVAQKTQDAKLLHDSDARLGVVVVNYDSARMEPFKSWALARRWDLVVLDESHRIKAPSGATSRFCWTLARRADHRLCLTGTPMAHSPLDIWSQFCFLAPQVFGRFKAFKSRYAIERQVPFPEILGYRDTEHLHGQIDRLAYRVKAADCLDLPEAVHSYRYCTLGKEGERVYRELDREFYCELDSGEVTPANAMVKLLRLQQVTGGSVGADDGTIQRIDHAKQDALSDLLADTEPQEPLVVFARFQADLDAIRIVSIKQERRYSELSGRRKDLETWQQGGADLLAVQIQAGGVGIDLTRARHSIYYSVGFSLGDYLQSLARIHRPGQSRSVLYTHLLAAGTVDERVYSALAKRRNVVDSILSGE